MVSSKEKENGAGFLLQDVDRKSNASRSFDDPVEYYFNLK
jgi:hypothetical protein